MTTLAILSAVILVCGICIAITATKVSEAKVGMWMLGIGLVLSIILLLATAAFGRDLDGRYAASPLHDWFKGLSTPGGGLCCDLADGTGIEAIDWFIDHGHYVVKVDGAFVEVPDNKVVKEPNRFGQAVVWTFYQNGIQTVRCFMPGSLG